MWFIIYAACKGRSPACHLKRAGTSSSKPPWPWAERRDRWWMDAALIFNVRCHQIDYDDLCRWWCYNPISSQSRVFVLLLVNSRGGPFPLWLGAHSIYFLYKKGTKILITFPGSDGASRRCWWCLRASFKKKQKTSLMCEKAILVKCKIGYKLTNEKLLIKKIKHYL